MKKDDIIAEVQQSFSSLPRPDMFIRGTCQCEECLEHEETMQSFTLENMPLDKLDRLGWDPICFASDEAFAYLMPGLVRLVLQHTDDYVVPFLFHLERSHRIAAFTHKQAEVLLHVLDYLTLERSEILDDHLAFDELNSAREKLEPVAAPYK